MTNLSNLPEAPKPRKRNTFPGVFKRGSTWSFVLWYTDPKGLRKQLWKGGFRTQDEAHKARVREEAERDKGIDIAPSRLTVGAWLERWLRDYASNLQPATSRTYAINLRSHVIPAIGAKLLKDLRPADVAACYAAIQRGGRTAKTALNVHRVLREAINHAVKLELVGRNVCDAVTPPRAAKFEVNPPTLDELDRILAAADETQFGRLVRFALLTGMRQGEIIRLPWRHHPPSPRLWV